MAAAVAGAVAAAGAMAADATADAVGDAGVDAADATAAAVGDAAVVIGGTGLGRGERRVETITRLPIGDAGAWIADVLLRDVRDPLGLRWIV
jgi:hypothetical protein